MTGNNIKYRNTSLDTWKGIAIIAVVGIHACNPSISVPAESPDHWTGLLFRSVFNFAVALFFAISGYFSPTAEEIQQRGTLRYYWQRLIPLWIPYLLWTALYLVIRDKASLFDPVRVAKSLFLGQGIGIGYFVIVLSSLVVVHPLLARLQRRKSLIVGAVLSAISVALLYWVRIEHHDHRFGRFPYTALPFTTWMVFYYLGFYIREKPKPLSLTRRLLLCLVVATFASSLAESLLISNYIGAPAVAASQVKFTTFFYSACVSIFALYFGTGRLDRIRFLSWAGRHSYVLYLCHMLFLKQVASVLLPALRHMQFVYIPASIALTVLAATACVFIAEKLLPSRLAFYVLGVKK